MSDIDLAPVNVVTVARLVKAQKQFILFSRDGDEFIMTASFMLRLRRYDAFLLQCKLEIEERGIWYEVTKEGTIGSGRRADPAQYIEMYAKWITHAASDPPLLNTGITISEFNGGPCDVRLLAGADGYVAIQGEYLTMVPAPKDFRRGSTETVVIDGAHVIAKMSDEIWRRNSFITRMNATEEDKHAK